MTETKIYLELSEEFQQLLADNQISIEDILQSQNIDAKVTYGTVPYQSEEGARTKDVVTIIFAASAAIISIGFAVSQVLDTIYSKPYLVEIYENEELRDADGNIVVDKYGQPKFKPVKRYELLEPKEEDKNKELEFNVGLENGIVIKVKTEEKEMQEADKQKTG